jgi:cellulose 1,4-beta-cellobiosidase
LDLGWNQYMFQSWNGNFTQSGQHVAIGSMSYNSTIPRWQSVGIGFNASYSGTNANPVIFYLNGNLCR